MSPIRCKSYLFGDNRKFPHVLVHAKWLMTLSIVWQCIEKVHSHGRLMYCNWEGRNSLRLELLLMAVNIVLNFRSTNFLIFSSVPPYPAFETAPKSTIPCYREAVRTEMYPCESTDVWGRTAHLRGECGCRDTPGPAHLDPGPCTGYHHTNISQQTEHHRTGM